MTDIPDRIPHTCPSCSPDLETVHEVLSSGGGNLTVRCGECGHVHKIQPPREREVTLDVIVSQDDESFAANVTTPAAETIETGDEFLLETAELLATVRVTSLEMGEQRRADSALAEDVETVWTREIDNVSVDVTIHPQDGRREQSRSITVYVPGDYEFVVGETESFGDDEFEIDGIAIRGDSDGYRKDKFDHDGDMVFAKDIKRIYAWDETSTAWSAW